MREAVLDWRPGADRQALWAAFLLAGPDEAARLWFGAACPPAAEAPEAQRHAIDRDIVAIDRMIAAQLDAVLHHPAFQKLEVGWRGLRWLVDQVEDGPGDRIVIRALNARWLDIARDLERAPAIEDSHLSRMIDEDEFGTAGGDPFGLLVVDHAVRHQPDARTPAGDRAMLDNLVDDKAVLENLAKIAAAAMALVVVAASPVLLGVDSFHDLANSARPAAALADDSHARWRTLRDMAGAESKFLAVVLPRMLARPPWVETGGIRYREATPGVADRLWMSGGFGFAAVAARAAARYGWLADVRGADTGRVGGGLVANLPLEPHRLSQTLSLPRLPTEVVFTAAQERMLIEAGLMPIGALPHGTDLLFGSGRCLYRVPQMERSGAAAFADSRVATQANAVLCASRFAHFLKVRGREAVGRLRRAEDIQAELRTWLMRFVNRNVLATAETRAAHPLYDAAVQVSERPDKPGVFLCSISLQPYFQLDDVSASFRFETSLKRLGSWQGRVR